MRPRFITKSSLLLLAVAGVFLNSTHAAVLADYDIQSASPVSAVTVGDNVTASSLVFSATGVNTTASFRGTNIAYISSLSNFPGGSDTPTTSDIRASWSVAPVAGNTITLDATESVTAGFRVFDQNTGSSTVYGKIFVASDSGFTTILAESDIVSSFSSNNAGPVVYATLNNGLVSTSTLYFGLALSSLESQAGANGQARFDDFTVNGVSIPEPSSALLVGLVCLFGVVQRRRRTH